MSKEDEKQEKARMWRVGIVAPGSSPSMAMDLRVFTDEEVADVAGEYSEAAPENCCVFAFRSRSESFDKRCAICAALAAVSIGKGEFDLGSFVHDLGAREASRIEALEADLAVSEHWRRDSDRLLAETVRRKTRCVFVALAVGALLGDVAAWTCFGLGWGKPALQEQSDQRGEDGHQQAVAARGETGEDPALLAGALLGVEGFEPGVGERSERDAGRVVAERAEDIAADQLRVDERGGDLERGGVGAVGERPLAGLRAEDAVFDVVHAGESSTDPDKLSPGPDRLSAPATEGGMQR